MSRDFAIDELTHRGRSATRIGGTRLRRGRPRAIARPEHLRPARQTPRPVLLQRQAAECRPTSSRRRRRRPTARSLPGWRGGCSTVSTFTCWTQTCRRASSPCTSRHSIMMAFVSHCEWANAHREGPVGYAPIASTQIPAPQIPPFGYSIVFNDVEQCSTSLHTSGEWP